MIRWIYYTIRNLWYYRKPRQISQEHSANIVRPNLELDDIRNALSDAMLATVGLKTVEDDKDKVPWYVPMSHAQKQLVSSVSEFGYKVGLK